MSQDNQLEHTQPKNEPLSRMFNYAFSETNLKNYIVQLTKDQEDKTKIFENIKKEINKKNDMLTAIYGLQKSWSYEAPGKDEDAYFFLDRETKDRVVLKNLLTKGTKICRDSKEWDKYLENKDQSESGYKIVPPYYKVCSTFEIATSQCNDCKTTQPIIEHYVQTEDNYNRSTWLKRKLILCLKCEELKEVDKKESTYYRL